MIIDLGNDKQLEIEGNKARILPDGIWRQFSINENEDVSIDVISKDTASLRYGNKQIIVYIRDKEITFEAEDV